MTKKELLEKFEECAQAMDKSSRIDSDYKEIEAKKILFVNYYELIKASLMFCPDNLILDGILSIEEIERADCLRENIKKKSAEELKIWMSAVLIEIKTFANIYASQDVGKLRNSATALAIRTEWLNKRQVKNHKIVFPLFITIFIILSIAVVVFAGLDAGKVFEVDSAMAKMCSIATTVAGALDAVNGVAFFIYERHDDKKKKNSQIDMDQAISGEKIKNSHNVIIAGKGATARIGDYKSTASSEDIFDTYVIKNSENKVKAKNNSRTDIGDY